VSQQATAGPHPPHAIGSETMIHARSDLLTFVVLAALVGCSNSSTEATDAKVQQQGDSKAATPDPLATVDTAPETSRDPTPETGSGGDQQTSQPEQPKPSP
jgi:hypothetical protein